MLGKGDDMTSIWCSSSAASASASGLMTAAPGILRASGLRASMIGFASRATMGSAPFRRELSLPSLSFSAALCSEMAEGGEAGRRTSTGMASVWCASSQVREVFIRGVENPAPPHLRNQETDVRIFFECQWSGINPRHAAFARVALIFSRRPHLEHTCCPLILVIKSSVCCGSS